MWVVRVFTGKVRLVISYYYIIEIIDIRRIRGLRISLYRTALFQPLLLVFHTETHTLFSPKGQRNIYIYIEQVYRTIVSTDSEARVSAYNIKYKG